jgi:tetrathionate reductase subunit A
MIDVFNKRISRRSFLKASAAAGGAVAATSLFASKAQASQAWGEDASDSSNPNDYDWLRTSCMMCNSTCGIQVKVNKNTGIAEKIAGNPFSPYTNDEFVGAGAITPSSVSSDLIDSGSRICAKGQAGLMTLYSPYRLRFPLKRTSPRGDGGWKKVSWKDAVNAICVGTGPEVNLPRASGGSYHIKNDAGADWQSIRANGANMPDADIHPQVGNDAGPGGEGDHLTGAARTAFRATIGGKAAQRLIMTRGRDQIGTTGYFLGAFGSSNNVSHEAMCNSAYKVSHAQTMQGSYNYGAALQAGEKGPNYYIAFGMSLNEAGVPHVPQARWTAAFRRRNGTTLVNTDIRVTQLMAKAKDDPKTVGLIVKPGTDGALANAILARWISQGTGSYAANYLKCVTYDSLVAHDSRPAASAMPCDAAHIVDTAANPPIKLKVSGAIQYRHIGDPAGNTRAISGNPAPAQVDLDWADGDKKTVFRMIKEELAAFGGGNLETAVDNLSAICGLAPSDVRTIADGAAAAGASNKLAVDFYRGAMAHANGYLAGRSIIALNTFQDTYNRIGGLVRHNAFGAGYPSVGTTAGKATDIAPSGARSDRAGGTNFGNENNDTLYASGAARYSADNPRGVGQPRRWFPRASTGNQGDFVQGAVEGYPYKVKSIYFMGGTNMLYSVPFGSGASNTIEAKLKAFESGGIYKVPLLVYMTTNMDETAAHCDFVLPAVTYLERWHAGLSSAYGGTLTQISHFRRPVVGAYRDIEIDGRNARAYFSPLATPLANGWSGSHQDLLAAWEGPMTEDDIFIAWGKTLNLKGYGENGFADASPADLGAIGWTTDNDTAYMGRHRMFANGGVTGGLNDDGASGKPTAFGPSVPLLYMGVRAADPAVVESVAGWGIPSPKGGSHPATSINLYLQQNALAGFGNASALPIYEPTKDLNGVPYTAAGYDLRGITYKTAWHTQARTTENAWLVSLTGRDGVKPGTDALDLDGLPTVWLNPAKVVGALAGLKDRDRVLVTTATNDPDNGTGPGVECRVQITGAVQEDCLVIDYHYGRRWFGGAKPSFTYGPHTAAGGSVVGDGRINIGPNQAALVEAIDSGGGVKDLALTCRISAQAGYQSSQVKIRKL